MENQKSKDKEERTVENLGWMVFCIAVVMGVVYFVYFGGYDIQKEAASWGSMGDFFGGILNPIIAGCALYVLVRSFKVQAKELKETKEAMEGANQAQKDLLQQQNQANQLQNFESLFIQLLDLKEQTLVKINSKFTVGTRQKIDDWLMETKKVKIFYRQRIRLEGNYQNLLEELRSYEEFPTKWSELEEVKNNVYLIEKIKKIIKYVGEEETYLNCESDVEKMLQEAQKIAQHNIFTEQNASGEIDKSVNAIGIDNDILNNYKIITYSDLWRVLEPTDSSDIEKRRGIKNQQLIRVLERSEQFDLVKGIENTKININIQLDEKAAEKELHLDSKPFTHLEIHEILESNDWTNIFEERLNLQIESYFKQFQVKDLVGNSVSQRINCFKRDFYGSWSVYMTEIPDQYLLSYFHICYQILNLISQHKGLKQIDGVEDDIELQQRYAEVFKVHLTESELQALLFHGLSLFGKELKPLLEQYQVFSQLSFGEYKNYSKTDVFDYAHCYEPRAFGNDSKWQEYFDLKQQNFEHWYRKYQINRHGINEYLKRIGDEETEIVPS